jgi:hypothetical protein
MLGAMLGLLGILVLGGLIVLSRDLRAIVKEVRENGDLTRELLRQVRQ